MDDKDHIIRNLTERIEALENEERYNFSSLKVFTKSIEVQGVISLKNYSSNPPSGRVGDLVVVSGKLKVCTVGGSSPTWTIVGTQT